MNPVLLKPSSDTEAQAIIHGKVRAAMNARDYHYCKTVAMRAVLESYARLRNDYSEIVVDGAGSPAEINLRDRVVGFVINRCRGDIALLEPGPKWLERQTAKPAIRYVPVCPTFRGCFWMPKTRSTSSNWDGDDSNPLRLHPDLDLHYV